VKQKRKNNKDGKYVVYKQNIRSELASINKSGKIKEEITQIGQFEECMENSKKK
jgi:hypothetical protein